MHPVLLWPCCRGVAHTCGVLWKTLRKLQIRNNTSTSALCLSRPVLYSSLQAVMMSVLEAPAFGGLAQLCMECEQR